MKNKNQSGVALVLTLVLLAVVTLMSVLFLGMSRRERASIRVTEDQTDARLAADTGLARAQAEVAGRIMAESNFFKYDLMVSTNLIRAAGFDRSLGTNPLNVAYLNADNGGALGGDDLRRMLSNLRYSPRAPVFVPTNGPNTNDFRFYLDLNRNGRFEENGLVTMVDDRGVAIQGQDGRPSRTPMVGDPEWVGVLQHPDSPHSSTNRFIGRYAYIVMPAGKSLDLNFIHNRSKFTTDRILANEGYHRNQGFGSWELNLAGFLRDLNTNMWDYAYAYQNLASPSSGFAFNDANALLAYRYQDSLNNLASVRAIFTQNGANAFRFDRIDGYARAVQGDTPPGASDPDNPDFRWAGSDNPRDFIDIMELFDGDDSRGGFTNRFRTPSFRRSTYDRYTTYRAFAQLGVDSAPVNRGKIHLHYDTVAARPTNSIAWEPVAFFTNAALRILRSELVAVTNGNTKDYYIGEYLFRPGIPVTHELVLTNLSIPIFPFNAYSPAVHRALQLSANIFDATTNRVDNGFVFPSVFRPVFIRSGTNIFISGYREVGRGGGDGRGEWSSLPWLDVRVPNQNSRIGNTTHANVLGVPWIIGAKKGFPNFNEYQLQTAAQVTRKLEFRKKSFTDRGPFDVHQMYIVGVSNTFGVETFHSYTNDYTRPTRLLITNSVAGALWDRRANRALGTLNRTISRNEIRTWRAGEIYVPFATNMVFIPDSAYFSLPSGDLRPLSTRPTFDPNPQHPTPEWDLIITNRLTMIAIDEATRRVVDFVNFDQLPSGFNVTTNLLKEPNVLSSREYSDSSFWLSNRLSNAELPAGHTNQIYVSSNDVLSDTDWASFSLNPVSGADKRKAIDGFRMFLGLTPLFSSGRLQPSTNLVVQVPFSPSRKFLQTMSWQANDPLVHTHILDLTHEDYSNPDLVIPLKPPLTVESKSNLGLMNPRYEPWGGSSNRTDSPSYYDIRHKDPLVRKSDDWAFPTNKFPTIGWLGRVHRGTPWQTVYLKASGPLDTNSWWKWAGTLGTHPTNDWKLMDLFTVAPNNNAARGLLSVNQTNIAAWSAVLSGVNLTTNTVAPAQINRFTKAEFGTLVAEPASPQLQRIVGGIMRGRTNWFGGVYPYLGAVLSVPELTAGSPFLNFTNLNQVRHGIDDAAYERIPQQIMSLLKADEPRLVVYSFGQALKPAGPPFSPPSIVAGGPFYGLCTNYQVTGEVVTKTVFRVDGTVQQPRIVVETHNVLPAE